jgi:periplasmic protein CpxP/Spy
LVAAVGWEIVSRSMGQRVQHYLGNASMTVISSTHLAAVAVAALLALAGTALAQSQAPASGSPGMEKSAPPSSPLAGHPVGGKTAQEQRIKELYSQLRITPAESPQWDQFAQVMRDNARDMDQAWLQRVDHVQSMNAVQNMQSYEQIAAEHAQHVQKLVPAFQNLYNVMSEQQKQLADQVFRENTQKQAQTHRAPNG